MISCHFTSIEYFISGIFSLCGILYDFDLNIVAADESRRVSCTLLATRVFVALAATPGWQIGNSFEIGVFHR